MMLGEAKQMETAMISELHWLTLSFMCILVNHTSTQHDISEPLCKLPATLEATPALNMLMLVDTLCALLEVLHVPCFSSDSLNDEHTLAGTHYTKRTWMVARTRD